MQKNDVKQADNAKKTNLYGEKIDSTTARVKSLDNPNLSVRIKFLPENMFPIARQQTVP